MVQRLKLFNQEECIWILFPSLRYNALTLFMLYSSWITLTTYQVNRIMYLGIDRGEVIIGFSFLSQSPLLFLPLNSDSILEIGELQVLEGWVLKLSLTFDVPHSQLEVISHLFQSIEGLRVESWCWLFRGLSLELFLFLLGHHIINKEIRVQKSWWVTVWINALRFGQRRSLIFTLLTRGQL